MKLFFNSNEELFEDIQRVYSKRKTISARMYAKQGKFRLSQINKKFKSFKLCLIEYNKYSVRDIHYAEDEKFIPKQATRKHSETTKKILSQKQHEYQIKHNKRNQTITAEKAIEWGEKMWNETHIDFDIKAFIKYSNISATRFNQLFEGSIKKFKQSLPCWNEIQLFKKQMFSLRKTANYSTPTREEILIMAQKVFERDKYLLEKNLLKEAKCTRRHMLKTTGGIKAIREFLNITRTNSNCCVNTVKLFETELKRIYNIFQHNNIPNFTLKYFLKHCDKRLTKYKMQKYFGTFAKFVQAYNIQPFQQEYRTREEVLKVAWDIYHNNNNQLNTSILKSSKLLQQKPIIRLFGSFNNLLKAMNLPYNKPHNVSKDKILSELRDIFNQHGMLTRQIIIDNASISYSTILKYCGSLHQIHQELNIIHLTSNNISNSAIICLDIISNIINEPYHLEKTFDWLVSTKTRKSLKLDGYFEKNKLAIEYDGPLHFKDTNFFAKDRYEQRHNNDKTKNILCRKHGILLIRIPYTEKLSVDNLKKIIHKKTIKHKNKTNT